MIRMPRLKVVGVVEEDQLVKDLKWSPKRSQQVSLSMLPKWQVLLSFGSSRRQKVLEDKIEGVQSQQLTRAEWFQNWYFSYFRSFRLWVQHQQWQTSICMFFCVCLEDRFRSYLWQVQVPPDSPVGEDHADDKQERTAATVPRLKTQESCKVVKSWSKGLRKLRTRQSTACALCCATSPKWSI